MQSAVMARVRGTTAPLFSSNDRPARQIQGSVTGTRSVQINLYLGRELMGELGLAEPGQRISLELCHDTQTLALYPADGAERSQSLIDYTDDTYRIAIGPRVLGVATPTQRSKRPLPFIVFKDLVFVSLSGLDLTTTKE